MKHWSKLALALAVFALLLGVFAVAYAEQGAAPSAQTATATPAPTAAAPKVDTSAPTIPGLKAWQGSPHADAASEAFRHWDQEDPQAVPVACAKCHSSAGYQDFLAKHREKYGEAPLAPFHAHAYDAYNLIADGVEKAAVQCSNGSTVIPRTALRDAMISTSGMVGLTGSLTCTATGDCADPKIAVYQGMSSDTATWNPGAADDSNPKKIWP